MGWNGSEWDGMEWNGEERRGEREEGKGRKWKGRENDRIIPVNYDLEYPFVSWAKFLNMILYIFGSNKSSIKLIRTTISLNIRLKRNTL